MWCWADPSILFLFVLKHPCMGGVLSKGKVGITPHYLTFWSNNSYSITIIRPQFLQRKLKNRKIVLWERQSSVQCTFLILPRAGIHSVLKGKDGSRSSSIEIDLLQKDGRPSLPRKIHRKLITGKLRSSLD